MTEPGNHGPFQHAPATVRSMDLEILLALVPAALAQLWLQGTGMLINLAVCYGTAGVLESLSRARPPPWQDLSLPLFVLMVVLLAPPDTPLLVTTTGIALASLLLRCSFGGPGKYPFNPVMTAMVFILLIRRIVAPLPGGAAVYPDIALLQTTWPPSLTGPGPMALWELRNLLVAAGGLLLLARGVIAWQPPLVIVAVLSPLLVISGIPGLDDPAQLPVYWLHGELLLVVFFIAPQNGPAPGVPRARPAYGVLLAGLLALLSRGSPPLAAAAVAILLGNLCAPLLDSLFDRRGAGTVTGPTPQHRDRPR